MEKTGYMFMINRAGVVLAYPPDKKQIMKLDLKELDFGKEIMKMKNGVLVYEYKGIKKLVAIREVSSTGWIMAATAPFAEIFSAAAKIRNLLIIIGLVITVVLFVGIILMVSFFVIKPLKQVVDGLRGIAQGEGDLTMRLAENRDDEVGDLAHWFNLFIENLQKLILQIPGNSETIRETSQVVSVSNKKINTNLKQISDSFGMV